MVSLCEQLDIGDGANRQVPYACPNGNVAVDVCSLQSLEVRSDCAQRRLAIVTVHRVN